MKILFIASGNHGAPSPVIQNQGDALVSEGVIVDYFLIKGKGIKGYLRNVMPLRKYMKVHQYDAIHAHYSLSAFVSVSPMISFGKLSATICSTAWAISSSVPLNSVFSVGPN